MKYYMDFSVILGLATLICFMIWGVDAIFFKKKRLAHGTDEYTKTKEPKLVEYAKSFFPILLAIFILRAFIIEPYRIPSGSMKPSLLVGDFILVNKYAYGLRMPLFGTKFIENSSPQRGQVLVFRYPKNTSINFIKRVIALPGDKVVYEDKKLYINDELMTQEFQEQVLDENDYGYLQNLKKSIEHLDGITHSIYVDASRPDKRVELTVPEGHYFVMGDNRDNSDDSRKWGFVPDELIVGKASYVWMSWDKKAKDVRWNRIGQAI